MNDPAALARTAFLLLHALTAAAALVAGLLAVRTGRRFGLHQVLLLAMAISLGPSLALGWSGFSSTARSVFLGLAGLAVAMVVQSFRARRVLAREAAAPGRAVGPTFVRTAGFNLVALAVAGTVVPVLRWGGGLVGVSFAVVVVIGIGHVLLERRARSVALAPFASDSTSHR